MNIIETLAREISVLVGGNETYDTYQKRWQFLLESYIGGEEYRTAGHLHRYQLETDSEYAARLRTTPLDNQCSSIVSVYTSFLFRVPPKRDFENNTQSFELEMFLRDADLDGRSLNSFMKDVATWSSIFGSCWVMVTKPDVGAQTLADEQALGVRPYVSLLTPLTVLDWSWTRQPNGRYELSYFRYLEDVNGNVRTVKEWTKDTIRTAIVDMNKKLIVDDQTVVNQLGKIPAVCCYNGRSPMRGLGVSDITDIADIQKMIYNLNSEIYESIRLDSHPSLVVPSEGAAVGTGAGSIIKVDTSIDPGHRPYLLEFSGASVDSIHATIKNLVDSIDKMANTGSIRTTEARRMSGVAQQQEFELLSARLSEKADNLELAEEQIWQLWFEYQGEQWMGTVEYPGSFNIRDTDSEIQQLKVAKDTATDAIVIRKIDEKILEWMGEEKELLEYQDIQAQPGRQYPDGAAIPESLPPLYIDSSDSRVPQGQNCANCEYYKGTESYCMKFDAPVRALYWCAKWENSTDLDNIE